MFFNFWQFFLKRREHWQNCFWEKELAKNKSAVAEPKLMGYFPQKIGITWPLVELLVASIQPHKGTLILNKASRTMPFWLCIPTKDLKKRTLYMEPSPTKGLKKDPCSSQVATKDLKRNRFSSTVPAKDLKRKPFPPPPSLQSVLGPLGCLKQQMQNCTHGCWCHGR